MNTRHRPRTTVVTGANSGIGKATSARLIANGSLVIGVDVAAGDVIADLAVPAGRAQAVARIRELCGDELDALVVCAGAADGPLPAIVAVNCFGATQVASELRWLLARGQAPRAVERAAYCRSKVHRRLS